MVTEAGSQQLKGSKYSYLQEGQEWVSTEFQDRKCLFSASEGDGVNTPGNHYQTYKGQKYNLE